MKTMTGVPAAEGSGLVAEDSSRAVWLPQARFYRTTLTRCWSGSSTMACGEVPQNTSGALSGAYPKNDNYAGRC